MSVRLLAPGKFHKFSKNSTEGQRNRKKHRSFNRRQLFGHQAFISMVVCKHVKTTKKKSKKQPKKKKEGRTCINTYDYNTGKLLLERMSISSTARKLKINSGSICNCFKGERNRVKNYRFVSVYAHDHINIGISMLQQAAKKCKKPMEKGKVQRMTPFIIFNFETNKIIGQFTSKQESIDTIETLTGERLNPGSVYQCLIGKRKQTGGYGFKYVLNDDDNVRLTPEKLCESQSNKNPDFGSPQVVCTKNSS